MYLEIGHNPRANASHRKVSLCVDIICVWHTFPKLIQLGNKRLKILCPCWALAWDLQVKTQQIFTLAMIIMHNQVGK